MKRSLERISCSNIKDWCTRHKGWIRVIAKIFVLLILFVVLFGVMFGFYRISGPAMSKRLEDGDLVMYSRMTSEYQGGDVVIYDYDGKTYVSAILAKADDLIEIDSYGRLHLNGAQVSDDIVFTPEQRNLVGAASAFRVPANSYYVLNEDLNSMEDSRSFGAIPSTSIKGKIIGVLRTRSI